MFPVQPLRAIRPNKMSGTGIIPSIQRTTATKILCTEKIKCNEKFKCVGA